MSLPYSLWIFNIWLQFLINQLFIFSNHLISTDFRWFLALCKKVTKVTHTNPQNGWLMKDINFGAFESLYDFYTAFPNEETCIAYLEKVLWPNGVVSPYDVSSKVYKRAMVITAVKILVRISMSVLVLSLKIPRFLCVNGFSPFISCVIIRKEYLPPNFQPT